MPIAPLPQKRSTTVSPSSHRASPRCRRSPRAPGPTSGGPRRAVWRPGACPRLRPPMTRTDVRVDRSSAPTRSSPRTRSGPRTRSALEQVFALVLAQEQADLVGQRLVRPELGILVDDGLGHPARLERGGAGRRVRQRGQAQVAATLLARAEQRPLAAQVAGRSRPARSRRWSPPRPGARRPPRPRRLRRAESTSSAARHGPRARAAGAAGRSRIARRPRSR